MAESVFLCFLGVTNYNACRYAITEGNGERKISSVTPYVQCAIAELTGANWTKAYVFTTKAAEEKHLNILRECWPIKGKEPENVHIDDGKNEAEIWNIFNTMMEKLKPGDEVYLDITHGFRSLPFLAGSLVQYAKFAKDIKVKAVYYGAYEARTTPAAFDGNAAAETAGAQAEIAPVFDMTTFSTILDWSSAAGDFINFGNSSELKKLTEMSVNPILRKTKGNHETARLLNRLAQNLDTLCMELKTCRGPRLIKQTSAANIREALASLKSKTDIISPLTPLFVKIEESVVSMELTEGNVSNMLKAVDWCIKKQLIQEGLTLLEEGIISYFMGDRYNDWDMRLFVSAYLQQYGERSQKYDDSKAREKYGDENVDFYKLLIDSHPRVDEWKSLCQTLFNSMRNTPAAANVFTKILEEHYIRVKELIAKDSAADAAVSGGFNLNARIIADAVMTAIRAHDGQFRKGTDIPYILHPLETGDIVSRIKYDPDLICAAYLHDTAEDAHMERDTLAYLFNDHVADLVFSLSEDKSKPWQERKQHTLDALSEASEEVKILTLADKLSNMRSISTDYSELGETLWLRFNVKEKGLHAQYYQDILKRLESLSYLSQYKELWELVDKVFHEKD